MLKAKPAAKNKKRSTGKKNTTAKSSSRSLLSIWIGAGLMALACIAFLCYFFIDPLSFRLKGAMREATYPEGYDIRGLDISHYQESVNWEQLRNASLNNDPIRFIIIKATEGKGLLDDNFNENFYYSKKNGFIRGAYHFFVPGVDARKQAEFFLRQVHLEEGDLPPVLDVEKKGKLSEKQLKKDVKTWLDIVEKKYRVKPIIYTGYKFKMKYLDDKVFDEYPYWIAHYYVDKLKYKGDWKLWQHTDYGKVPGIEGPVDCNIFNGTLQELHDFTLKDLDREE